MLEFATAKSLPHEVLWVRSFFQASTQVDTRESLMLLFKQATPLTKSLIKSYWIPAFAGMTATAKSLPHEVLWVRSL